MSNYEVEYAIQSFVDGAKRWGKWIACFIVVAGVGIAVSYVIIPSEAYGNVNATVPMPESIPLIDRETCSYRYIDEKAKQINLILIEVRMHDDVFPIAENQCVRFAGFRDYRPDTYKLRMDQWFSNMIVCSLQGKCYVRSIVEAGIWQGVSPTEIYTP